MNYIQRLRSDLARERAMSGALRAGLYDLRRYACSDKYAVTETEPMPVMNPADVVLRVDEALTAADDVESGVQV